MRHQLYRSYKQAFTLLLTLSTLLVVVSCSMSSTYSAGGSPTNLAGTSALLVTITPASHNFGSVAEGTLSAAAVFTVANDTTAGQALTIAATAPFGETNTCGTSLAASSSCTISATFGPTTTGLASGSISVSYGATHSSQKVTLTGTGVAPIQVSPSSIAFPSTGLVGEPSASHTVTVTNDTSSAVTLDSIVASPAAYAITGKSCGTSLAASSSCTLTVVFTPAVVGTTTGTVTITFGSTRAQIVVPMTGEAQVNRLVSLAITTPSASLATGATEQLTATGTYANGTTANVTDTATWSSSDTPVATVGSSTGLVTGVSAGTVVITAAVTGTSGGTIKNTADLTIQAVQNTLTGITLTSVRGSTTPIAPPTLAAGTTGQLYATGSYSNGSTQDITSTATWASSSTASATVADGLITAVAVGTPSISATLSGITASTAATITAPTLLSISITPATATVAAGNSQQFTATGTYSNKTTQNITADVTWSSSNSGVTMSATTAGLATAGDAAIGASVPISASMGTVTAATPAVLTVGPAALVSIAVTPANASIAEGTTEAFTATGTYSDGSTQNLTSTVTWSATTASGGGAATFSSTTLGLAQATAEGVVTITATSGATSGSTTLTVTAPVLTSIVVTNVAPATPPVAGSPAVVTIYQGQTEQFYALGTYSDSSIQNITSQVAWSAGTGSVATVSTAGATAGLATAVAAGTVAISATSGTITSAATGGNGSLTVIGLTAIALTPADPTAALGDANTADPYGASNNTLQFTATATFADNTTQNVTASSTWTSGTQTVATVGGTTGLATVIAVGTSTVTATYAGVSGNTLLTVTAAILESITVTPTGVSLGLNGTQQFTATGTYSDGATANLTQTATWASANSPVVTVSTTGLATVVSAANVAVGITASSGSVAPFGSTNTGFVSALSTLPTVCPSPTIDMNLLVINNAEANNGAGYADFPAIQQVLNYVGTPYTVVDVSAAAPTLSDGACHAYYQGVIFAYGGDYYNIPSWQSALISFEQTFNLRQLNWYDVPDPNFGLSFPGTQIPDTETYTTNFTAAAAPIFFYANLATPLTISNAAVDLAAADAASGGVLTPLLQDASGNIVSATYTYNGQQFLSQTFDSNPYLTHDLVVAYGLLNWVTKGVFLGDYHVYATQEVDDFFINDTEWIPSTPCLANSNSGAIDRTAPDASNLPVFRVNSNDMAQLVAWQKTKQADPLLSQFELTFAFNGVGTTGNGDWTGLVAPIVSSSATGGVATFIAQDFSGQVGDTVVVSNTANGGGVLNGTWTITSVTLSAATTPGTSTFTANVTYTGVLTTTKENGVADNPATAQATEVDSLVENLQQYQQYFHWISHTYDHPTTLNGLCKSTPSNEPTCGDIYDNPPTDDIDLEVLTNLYVASASGGVNLDTEDTVVQLTFTDFNPGNIITPGVTGLNDPNVPGYLYQDGIRYAVSDTSVATTTNPPNNNGPNPSPNVGIVNSYEPLLYEVPRHPNDVFYNVANWADDQAEFDCIYSYYVAPGSTAAAAPDPPFNTYNAAQVLDFTSTAFVNNMLMGDMDPEMFHQPDLHFSQNYANLTSSAPSGTIPSSVTNYLGTTTSHVSSLLSDTYDLTFAKYEALYQIPVLTPTLDQLGVLMQNRNSFNLSGVTASIVGAGTSSATITLTMPSTATVSTAVIPVTGLTSTGSEVYGGQNISHINMTPGQTVTFPLP